MVGLEQLGNNVTGSEPDGQSEDDVEKDKDKHERTAMPPPSKKTGQQARSKEAKASVKVQDALAAAQVEIEHERQKRIEAERALTDAQETLASVNSKLEIERQSRVKAEKAKAQAEKTLGERSNTIRVSEENVERSSKFPGEAETERRLSFIVRLTVDERSVARRTEIEHTQTRRKESFPALDGERLMAFIQSCMNPKPAQAPLSTQKVDPLLATHGRSSSPIVADVRVLRAGMPDATTLSLNPEEAFVLQTRFQFLTAEDFPHSNYETLYEMSIYAKKLNSRESTLLTTHTRTLPEDVREDIVQMEVPSLSPGAYRLLTVVTLLKPIKEVRYSEGPIVQVN